jgi:predicted metal-dependent HD superfamily phosphohydrolase
MTDANDFEGAIRYALNRLALELRSDLLYHSVWHTSDEVLPAVVALARRARVGPEATMLLKVAAAYHDLGFIEQVHDHELVSIELAWRTLPEFGLHSGQIETIAGMIRATRMPQVPYNFLEALLADADLDVLGRPDFFKRNHDYRLELVALGQTSSDVVWYETHLRLLETHAYFTQAAIQRRGAGKQKNMAELKRRLEQAGVTT